MKTLSLLDKYSKLIAGLLSVDPNRITFEASNGGAWVSLGEYKDPDKDEIQVNNFSLGTYRVQLGATLISSWKLYQMPHCCGILVSCQSRIEPEFRNQRIGTTLNSMRQDIGRDLGYSLLFCTDVETNPHQRQLLKNNGWKDVHEFINKRTRNKIKLSVLDI